VQDILDRLLGISDFKFGRSVSFCGLSCHGSLWFQHPSLTAGRPGDLCFFFKLIKLGSKRIADRTVSSICTEELYGTLTVGWFLANDMMHCAFYRNLKWQGTLLLKAYGACAWDIRISDRLKCLQTYVIRRTRHDPICILTKVITDRNWVHHCRRSSVIEVNWFLADSHWWRSRFSGVLRFFWGFRAR